MPQGLYPSLDTADKELWPPVAEQLFRTPLVWTTGCIGNMQGAEASGETPERAESRLLPDWAVSQSPAENDALLAGHTPSNTLQLQRPARGGRADGTPETLADLELDVAGRTLSTHSCASFNSEEGFGSPMAGKHRRRNSINMDDYDGNVGPLPLLPPPPLLPATLVDDTSNDCTGATSQADP